MSAQQLFQEAQTYHQQQQFNLAKSAYQSLLEQFPDHAEGHHFLGILLSQTGEFLQGIQHLEQAANFVPQNPVFLINLGEALARNSQYTKAAHYLKQAIALNPSQAEAHFNLANVYKQQGEYALAIDFYHEVFRFNPNHPGALLHLANIYIDHRLFKPAARYLNLFLTFNPDHPTARQQYIFACQNISHEEEVLAQLDPYQTIKHEYPDFNEDPVIFSYLELLKKCLTNTLTIAEDAPDFLRQAEGMGWPIHAETMIGRKRMDNVHYCVSQVIQNQIPGDLIETGVWRGGACILMRGILKAYQETKRQVWVADSFQGLPPPDIDKYPQDSGSKFHLQQALKVPQEKVEGNFKKYDLLDDQIRFLKGFFSDTLPTAPIEQLAVLRLDGDMYESTMDALVNLYPKLSKGGYIIIDDYGVVPQCEQALVDYRQQHNISTTWRHIDHSAVFWIKE